MGSERLTRDQINAMWRRTLSLPTPDAAAVLARNQKLKEVLDLVPCDILDDLSDPELRWVPHLWPE